MGFRLKKHENLANGLQRVLSEEASRIAKDVDAARKAPVKGIHEARKRCKRSRALLRLMRPERPGTSRRGNAAFRDIAHGLATFRDGDAQLEAFDALVGRRKGGGMGELRILLAAGNASPPPEEFASCLNAAEKLATAARAALETEDAPKKHGYSLIKKGLCRTYRRGGEAMENAYREPSAESFHAWRKRVKDLYFQIQFLQKLHPRSLGPLASQIDLLGEILGQDHDLILIEQALANLPSNAVPPETLRTCAGLIRSKRSALRRQARLLGRRIYRESPKDFTRRLKAYWRAFRE